jgi:hypothetical protein
MTALLLAALLLAAPCTGSTDDEVPVPAGVKAFVTAGTTALACEVADLNRDGLDDVVLVLERQKAKPDDPDIETGQRPLLVLVRQPDGTYREVKRNDHVVYCKTCGGIMGDPFQGVDAGPGAITVLNAGGSSWRWAVEYRFAYSRRDATWQLVRVEETSLHAGDPTTEKVSVYTPPKHYGKIDIADFDPENWKGKGPR